MAARVIDKELLEEALEKIANVNVEGWLNQTGADTEALFEMLSEFAMAHLLKSPILALIADEEQVIWLLSTYSTAFQLGWFTRALQKGDIV